MNEALIHGGLYNDAEVEIKWINAEDFDKKNISRELKDSNGILVPGGFGERGVRGKISSIKYARENNIPFLEFA